MDIFFLVGILKSSFFMYYGRQLRQLTNVQNYGLLGPTPRKGKSNVLVDLHPLALIVPCMNLFKTTPDSSGGLPFTEVTT